MPLHSRKQSVFHLVLSFAYAGSRIRLGAYLVVVALKELPGWPSAGLIGALTAPVSLMYTIVPSGLNAMPLGWPRVSSTTNTAPEVWLYR